MEENESASNTPLKGAAGRRIGPPGAWAYGVFKGASSLAFSVETKFRGAGSLGAIIA